MTFRVRNAFGLSRNGPLIWEYRNTRNRRLSRFLWDLLRFRGKLLARKSCAACQARGVHRSGSSARSSLFRALLWFHFRPKNSRTQNMRLFRENLIQLLLSFLSKTIIETSRIVPNNVLSVRSNSILAALWEQLLTFQLSLQAQV